MFSSVQKKVALFKHLTFKHIFPEKCVKACKNQVCEERCKSHFLSGGLWGTHAKLTLWRVISSWFLGRQKKEHCCEASVLSCDVDLSRGSGPPWVMCVLTSPETLLHSYENQPFVKWSDIYYSYFTLQCYIFCGAYIARVQKTIHQKKKIQGQKLIYLNCIKKSLSQRNHRYRWITHTHTTHTQPSPVYFTWFPWL